MQPLVSVIPMEPSQLRMLHEWLQQPCAMQCMQTELMAMVKHWS